jgi:anti-sigma factor RsiW
MSRLDSYTCEHVFQLLDDYVDRELSAGEMQKVQEHLAICAACASEYQFHDNMLQAIRERVQRISVSVSFRERIAAALKQVQSEMDTV